ncbi:gametocyte-specific factor 1 homolog [Ceratina calcarata]|uniref:Gametocyte-specific factor 1 homolog n=1 Tax=Ceratina calcarata TaxID=156304 RepID=A0AAJ7N8M5_9HYME|nr:gametocyte-specific factor 1 homolog [Ceratina calcarata]
MFDRKAIVSCPYDSTHKIKESVLPYHLIRCRRNQINLRKVICPYNVWHVIDEKEIEEHVACCPSSGTIKNLEYCYRPLYELGTVSLETTKNLPVAKMEDWKEENVPQYDPWKVTESRDVIRCLIGGTRSQKKKFREYEQKRWSNLSDERTWSPNLRQQFKTLHITPQKMSTKVLNLAQLIKSLEHLQFEDIDVIANNIDLEKLIISDVKRRNATINGEPIPKIIEEVLVKELRKLVVHCLKE